MVKHQQSLIEARRWVPYTDIIREALKHYFDWQNGSIPLTVTTEKETENEH